MFLGFKLELTQNLDWHQHRMHEFVVCMSGSGHYRVGDERYECRPGRTLFIPSKIGHSIEVTGTKPLVIYFFCMEPEKLSQFIPVAMNQNLMPLFRGVSMAKYDAQNAKETLDTVTKVIARSNGLVESPSYMVMALLNELFAYHLDECPPIQSSQLASQSGPLQRVIDWITENYAEEISVDTMAQQANMSRSTFTRQFRKQTGMSLIDYCLKLRVQAAADALATSDTSITDLAYDCGFTNLSYFHRVFRKHTKMSPGEYRNFLRFQGMA